MELVGFGDLPDHVLHVAEQAVRGLQQQLSRVRQRDLAPPPVQQDAPQFVLEQLDLTADRGLRDVKPLSRAREAPLLRDRPEHLQLPYVHPRAITESDRSDLSRASGSYITDACEA